MLKTTLNFKVQRNNRSKKIKSKIFLFLIKDQNWDLNRLSINNTPIALTLPLLNALLAIIHLARKRVVHQTNLIQMKKVSLIIQNPFPIKERKVIDLNFLIFYKLSTSKKYQIPSQITYSKFLKIFLFKIT